MKFIILITSALLATVDTGGTGKLQVTCELGEGKNKIIVFDKEEYHIVEVKFGEKIVLISAITYDQRVAPLQADLKHWDLKSTYTLEGGTPKTGLILIQVFVGPRQNALSVKSAGFDEYGCANFDGNWYYIYLPVVNNPNLQAMKKLELRSAIGFTKRDCPDRQVLF